MNRRAPVESPLVIAGLLTLVLLAMFAPVALLHFAAWLIEPRAGEAVWPAAHVLSGCWVVFVIGFLVLDTARMHP